jgi:hypothetical protein
VALPGAVIGFMGRIYNNRSGGFTQKHGVEIVTISEAIDSDRVLTSYLVVISLNGDLIGGQDRMIVPFGKSGQEDLREPHNIGPAGSFSHANAVNANKMD